MNLLTDNNEVTQDVAAKGVALVYENCDSSQKQTMVHMVLGNTACFKDISLILLWKVLNIL